MPTKFRNFTSPDDSILISEFLATNYEEQNQDGNWLQAIWDYSYTHPSTRSSDVNKIGLWFDHESLVGATIFDIYPYEVSLCTTRHYRHLRQEMLLYSQEALACKIDHRHMKQLMIYVKDDDHNYKKLLMKNSYRRSIENDRIFLVFNKEEVNLVSLNQKYYLHNLYQANDLNKIRQILHRGFGHEGESNTDIGDIKKMQSSPNFRADMTIVIENEVGDYITYCGMWYDARNKIGYIEPMATDPKYRGMGLGKAAILESIKRCKENGAQEIYVVSTNKFYTRIGFIPKYCYQCWENYF